MQEATWPLLMADLVLCLVLSSNSCGWQRSAGRAAVGGRRWLRRASGSAPRDSGGSCHPGTGTGSVWLPAGRGAIPPWDHGKHIQTQCGKLPVGDLLPWGPCGRFPGALGAEKPRGTLRWDAPTPGLSSPPGGHLPPLASAAISTAHIQLAPQDNTPENRFWGKAAFLELKFVSHNGRGKALPCTN